MDLSKHQAAQLPGAGGSFGLWYGFLGGALAWMLHLSSVYVIGEFGCLSEVGDRLLAGLTVVAWMVLGMTVLTEAAALGALIVANRYRSQASRMPPGSRESWHDTAMTGVALNAFFAVAILFESIPVFYYLHDC